MSRAAQTGQRVLGDNAGEPAAAIPLKVRDEVVGVLGFYKDTAGETWTAEETTLLETLADQLSTALESARLYQDAQSLAARERLLGDVTARVRETLDVDMVLKTAVQEARQALGLPEVVIRLVSPVLAAPADNGSHGKEGRS
jgi:GAF domain-containing protein